MPSDPRRRIAYAQNFLRSPRLVDRLLARSSIGPTDLVVEIGPGTGIITARLAAVCRQVLAIEQDAALTARLRDRLAATGNVALFEADARSFPMPVTGFKVFANIPFNATAAIVERLTTEPSTPLDAYLVVQREAAARFLGEPRESLAALRLKPWFEPTLLHRFERTDFDPVPQVEVVLLRLRKRGPPLVMPLDAQSFRDLLAFAFTAWRPTVRDALAQALGSAAVRRLERSSGVALDRSPTNVPLADWLVLADAFWSAADERARSAVSGAEARLRVQQASLHKIHRTRTPSRRR